MAMKTLALILCGVILSLWTTQAWGQTCYPRDRFVNWLKEKHQESQRAVGVAKGSVIEFWSSEDEATFTIFATLPNGYACPIASGEDWEPVPQGTGL